MSKLAVRELDRLAELEVTIASGLQTFVEVGSALSEIRDERLYRSSHRTFEDYCRERWQISKPYATQLIGAAKVVENVAAIATTAPATESQARPLTKLKEPEQQQEAWKEAVETAPDGKVTAAHVAAVVEKRKPTLEPVRRAKPSALEEMFQTCPDCGYGEDEPGVFDGKRMTERIILFLVDKTARWPDDGTLEGLIAELEARIETLKRRRAAA